MTETDNLLIKAVFTKSIFVRIWPSDCKFKDFWWRLHRHGSGQYNVTDSLCVQLHIALVGQLCHQLSPSVNLQVKLQCSKAGLWKLHCFWHLKFRQLNSGNYFRKQSFTSKKTWMISFSFLDYSLTFTNFLVPSLYCSYVNFILITQSLPNEKFDNHCISLNHKI